VSGTLLSQMAEVNTGRTYGGRSGDERVRGRRDALVRAAFGLAAAEGWGALRIDALCRAAGLNKRYFYESFDGLEAVADAVVAWVADEAMAVALAEVDPAAPDEAQTRAAVRALVAHLTDDERRARLLFGEAGPRRAEALRRLVATVVTVGRALKGLDEDPVVETAAAMMVGGTAQAVLDWLDGRVGGTREALADDLVVLWHALADAAAARARDRRA
jgi:AcrR family transcriptional regulator